MTDLKQSPSEREAHLFALAERLQFSVEKQPERESGLTLEEAEELLRRWKLRGLGGG